MRVIRRRKCKSCKELFEPDRRNAWHQSYCSKPPCRCVSKAASQRRWLNQPCNRGYFRGADNVERMRQWRAAHPGYWRKEAALQEVIMAQSADNNSKSSIFAESLRVVPEQQILPLQEVIANQPLILIGLIANLTGATLQDDIATTSRHLLRLGRDVMGRVPNGEASSKTTAIEARTASV